MFGVAMLNLEYGCFMVSPNERLDEFMSPSILRFTHGAFLLKWPGYCQESFVLTLVDPRTRRHVTRRPRRPSYSDLQGLYQSARNPTCDADGAMWLGIDDVSYDHVRLVELFTKDGMTFHAQYGLNAHLLVVT
ncbi:hypothetical protein B0H11DRAFT_1905815 [Mycena galericulata]|nr:hypothetical protein B0H11DRAFT_1905815 [Mycena galericulata]